MRGEGMAWPETAPTEKKSLSRETRAGSFSCRPRAPAFRALKKSEKTGSNSRRQLMIMTLAGFGGGVRGEGMAWPEAATTVKTLFLCETRAGFYSCRPRAPAFRALKKSEKNDSNSRRQLMTPGGGGMGDMAGF